MKTKSNYVLNLGTSSRLIAVKKFVVFKGHKRFKEEQEKMKDPQTY